MDRRETDFKPDEPDEIALRQEDSPDPSSRSLELFQQGEELFSRGLYQRAIHVWTRILFIDRGNAEARQQIDRAKEAEAERQRRLDAEIAEARGLFEQKDLEGARERVASVLALDARHSEAMTLAEAIAAAIAETVEHRSESAAEALPEAGPAAPPAKPSTPSKGVVFKVPKAPPKAAIAQKRRGARSVGSRLEMAAFASAVLLVFAASALYLQRNWETIVSGGAPGRGNGAAAMALPDFPAAPTPDLSEIRFYNGERLFAQERYREALAELRRVDRDSKVVGEARSLILRIEDRLLRGPTETGEEIDGAR